MKQNRKELYKADEFMQSDVNREVLGLSSVRVSLEAAKLSTEATESFIGRLKWLHVYNRLFPNCIRFIYLFACRPRNDNHFQQYRHVLKVNVTVRLYTCDRIHFVTK